MFNRILIALIKAWEIINPWTLLKNELKIKNMKRYLRQELKHVIKRARECKNLDTFDSVNYMHLMRKLDEVPYRIKKLRTYTEGQYIDAAIDSLMRRVANLQEKNEGFDTTFGGRTF